jgi:Patatin-like phospholipase
MASLRAILTAALLFGVGVARAAQPPASITISGGVSLGSYEAGLVYYVVEAMRLNPAAATPRIVTGASAGSVNGLMTILQSCGAAVPDPTASLFWNAWIPLGLEKLYVKGQPQETSAFSRTAFDAPLQLIVRAWNAGLPESCDAVFGLSVTRLVPRTVTTEGDRLSLPRVEEHFVVRIQGRGAGKPPRLTNYVDPKWPGEQTLLPEKDGEVIFSGLVDALFASTAFPGAFPPQAIRHCVVSGVAAKKCPPEKGRVDLFIDGGVFDNTPVRLAIRFAAAGLRADGPAGARWLDAPDLSVRNLPRSLVVAYVSTEAHTFPEAADAPPAREIKTLLDVTGQVGASFLATGRAKNLLYVHDDSPEVFEQLLVPERHLPAASSPLGAFFGFIESELRRFDFALGMYDGRRGAEARLAARLERAGGPEPKYPEETPAARLAAGGWRRFKCLQTVMDAAPGAQEACAGDDLRDFRIVFQTSIERLWDSCARLKDDSFDSDPLCRRARLGEAVRAVPFVDPLAADAWRRRENENDAAYSMRLLAAHQFQFADLGLRRDEAEKAPAALRAKFLAIGDSVANAQPSGEGLLVSTMVRMAADQVAYVPQPFTMWAMYGRDPEIGLSKGFETGGVFVTPVRLHADVQFVGANQILSSESGNFAIATLAGVEYLPASWATTRFQPSLLLRGGWLFSFNDGGGFGDCTDQGSSVIGACSRPAIQGGVSATLLERIRLQVTGNWYPPAHSGEKHQWSIGPGIGVQWGL